MISTKAPGRGKIAKRQRPDSDPEREAESEAESETNSERKSPSDHE